MFGCNLKISGHFPDNKNFVIMANHVSFLDVFAIPSCFKGKFSAVAASMNFKIPIYATLLNQLKVVSINRSNNEEAIKSIKKAEKVLNSGYSIVVLPEGTRTLDGKLADFKKGGFHLAKNTESDILPIITNGLFNIKPKNRWNIQPGIIEINIMKPINSKNKSVDELLKETYDVFNNCK
ncbi:lysophospholipid acyltransferase family protein [Candidatus Marinimicrobia bacterium]|nr:lysophospholipid acyltransferase family protein [Candidatus Neomarinimicrobiota bacterium]